MKNSFFVINHIVSRVLKEDISSLDVDNTNPDKIEIYKKIRKTPFIKRFAITKSNKTGKIFEHFRNETGRLSIHTGTTKTDLNNSLSGHNSPKMMYKRSPRKASFNFQG